MRLPFLPIVYFAAVGLAAAATPPLETNLVEVGGNSLEVARTGAGAPAVVFLHGGGSASITSWQKVLGKFDVTSIAYARAGYGRSTMVDGERTPAKVAAELRGLLDKLAVPPPYVVVGASLGGIYARVFAMQYPAEVAGLVLVDPLTKNGDF